MTFGKVMGGGFPAAAFGGRADVMAMLAPEGPVYQAGTLSGNPVATTAGLATLRLADRRGLRPPRPPPATRSRPRPPRRWPRPACRTSSRRRGNMFCVFFTDRGRPVPRLRRRLRAGHRRRYAAFFHAMLDQGVYLPPRRSRRGSSPPPTTTAPLQTGPRRPARRRPRRGRRTRPRGRPMSRPDTIVHLLRHGEVHNPTGVLYGRLPGFHLSELGRQMAQRVADAIGDRDITHLVASPLERAQETAQPLARGPRARGRHRRPGDRVDQRLRGQARSACGDGAAASRRGLAAPVEPVPAVVGRALQGGRRPDDGRGPRRPRRGRAATRR